MRNVLIVTGGGRGIGAAVSRLAAARGYAVCVNYRSDKTFLCSKEAVLRMSTAHGGPGGAIVNVSSAAARLGSPGEYVDYAASKGAMDTLTTGLSVEVAREGIRVNAVRPGSSARPCTPTAASRAGWTACSISCPWAAAASRRRWPRPLSGFSPKRPRS